jgi:hypothetical protein
MATDWAARFTPFDRKLLIIVAILVASSFLILLGQTTGGKVVVSRDDKIIFVAPLDKNRRAELEGPLGITVLEIKDGSARIISSPCTQKICIRMGEARRSGDLLACIPNHLVINIEGDKDGEDGHYDFIQR